MNREAENINRVEPHGCIVCGKIHQMLVVYSPSGAMVACSVISPGGRPLPDDHRPLAVCSNHSAKQVQRAFSSHYPGMEQPEDREEE
jgi:hypothetical protein